MKEYEKDKMKEYKIVYGRQWREKWAAFEKTQEFKFAVEMARANMSIRAINGVLNGGARNWLEITTKTRRDWLGLPNFGKKSLAELVSALATRDMSLAGDSIVSAQWPGWQLGYVD